LDCKDEKENEQEFEAIEHSMSIGDGADCIFADLEHENFVMRQTNSPMVEKSLFSIEVSHHFYKIDLYLNLRQAQ
jgi:hypothetical protein